MSQQSVLFFGATGGVVNACLTQTLKSGAFSATALVRTPEKLTRKLHDQQKLAPNELVNLNILAGDALDVSAVKSALLASRPDVIVTGLGAVFDKSHPFELFEIDQISICGDAANVLVEALSELQRENALKKPHLAFVSTTGISRGVEDVPFGMQTLYHWILKKPHVDKRRMENTFRGEKAAKCFASVTGIRPTLLTGAGVLGEGVGSEKIRAGTEAAPQKGFSIARGDVGTFIWQNVVNQNKKKDGKVWQGEMISLTS